MAWRKFKVTMEFKLFKCSNCNNETLMEIHARNKIENGDLFGDSYYYDEQVVLKCPSCKNYNIINAYWDSSYGKVTESKKYEDIYCGDNVYETILYPVVSELSNGANGIVPNDILKTFRKSLELKPVDSESCLVKLRKTLELICKDKNAIGRNLNDKLKKLFELGILPPTLKSASNITRKLGNMGAHESDIEISTTELSSTIKLVEYIIQYIYILPNEIEILEKKIK